MILEQKQKLSNLVVCGDLNVLEPSHQPHYSFLRDWEYKFYESFAKSGLIDAFRFFYPDVCEYSWYGRKGYGYRYDHCFVTKELKKYTKLCKYLHEPRKNRLSDHSAMILELDLGFESFSAPPTAGLWTASHLIGEKKEGSVKLEEL